jgi:prepilin-type N-terminal cleavage/methylation domain-containing protein
VKEKGFTLLEVLVVVGITSFVSILLYRSLGASLCAWDRVGKDIETYQTMRVTLDRIRESLGCAFFSPLNPNLRFKGDRSKMYFAATSPNDPSGYSRLLRIGYAHDKRHQALLMKEACVLTELDKWGSEEWVVLIEGVSEMEFEYWKGGEVSSWRHGWDSETEGGLPDGVRIRLKLLIGEKNLQLPPVFFPINVNLRVF